MILVWSSYAPPVVLRCGIGAPRASQYAPCATHLDDQDEAGDNWIDRPGAFQTQPSRLNQYSVVVSLGTFNLRPACELPISLSATRTAN